MCAPDGDFRALHAHLFLLSGPLARSKKAPQGVDHCGRENRREGTDQLMRKARRFCGDCDSSDIGSPTPASVAERTLQGATPAAIAKIFKTHNIIDADSALSTRDKETTMEQASAVFVIDPPEHLDPPQ